MSCCSACATNKPCGSDKVGAIKMKDGSPFYDGQGCTSIEGAIPEDTIISPGQVTDYLLASIPGTEFPVHCAKLAGAASLRLSAGPFSSVGKNCAPIVLCLLSAWRVYGESECGRDPSAERYLHWLREKLSSKDADGTAASACLKVLLEVYLNSEKDWLKKTISFIQSPAKGVKTRGARMVGFCYPNLGEIYR